MGDDFELAALLGEAPRTPDPAFRFDVMALTAERARRRGARQRAGRMVLVFTLAGLMFPLAQAFGVGFAEIQPLLLVAAVLGLAYVLALLTIKGPRAALARSRALLRMSFMRA